MNTRMYFTMFKNEPDILTVPDVIRLLRIGKNTVYSLIKEGSIAGIKQGQEDHRAEDLSRGLSRR